MADYQNFTDRPLHKRTYEAIRRELAPFNFSEDLVQSLWHRLNGREEVAESYLNAFIAEQEAMRTQLSTEPREPIGTEMTEMHFKDYSGEESKEDPI